MLGTIKVEADTTVAIAERLVNFATLKITETNFGSLNRHQTRQIMLDIEEAMPQFERVIALERVLAGLDTSQIIPRNVEGVKADPPAIFFSMKPAVLVSFDGDPDQHELGRLRARTHQDPVPSPRQPVAEVLSHQWSVGAGRPSARQLCEAAAG